MIKTNMKNNMDHLILILALIALGLQLYLSFGKRQEGYCSSDADCPKEQVCMPGAKRFCAPKGE